MRAVAVTKVQDAVTTENEEPRLGVEQRVGLASKKMARLATVSK